MNTVKDDPQVSQWYQDLYRSATVSRNRWFLVGVISLVLVSMEGLALFALTPLKTVEPYVIQVDNKSGVTTVLTPLKNGNEKSLTEEEALTKSFIVKYVLSREIYDPQDLHQNYNLVRVMSASDEALKFESWINPINPLSPLERYKNTIIRTARISSVSFLDRQKKTAQVRFSTTESGRNNESREDYWIAILTFRYVIAPMDENDRLTNPLGFQVVSYRVDQEMIR